ncbi:unnamed protein product [Plutella xylostella]|uniref:(diamondback moth) hypothetical protein n=1 Tax=Plutella xylostella TaxID=51655 RepID=A0A8S4G5V5_PLUXY|nr:unnamed protein product [Plutella xylostella]
MTPLDYSLEKVKENNARILENIQLLNRSFSYAKEKESESFSADRRTTFSCKVCGKCFVYETGLKRHYSVTHAMLEPQPRWQVVWTCVECYQVWPQQQLAFKHTVQCCQSESTDCIQEIKTSSLLQCEFCEKVYTCIPRLLKHSKLHVTARNYECNCEACSQCFRSTTSLQDHRNQFHPRYEVITQFQDNKDSSSVCVEIEN